MPRVLFILKEDNIGLPARAKLSGGSWPEVEMETISRLGCRANVEFVRKVRPRPVLQVLFDFDGTLSLLREGWPQIMLRVFLEALPSLADEEDGARAQAAANDIAELTGAPTIDQMIRLAERVSARGGVPHHPLAYKREYLRRLEDKIAPRKQSLRLGQQHCDAFVLPGTLNLLEGLKHRGLTLHLVSGTDESSVLEESRLLSLAPYFGTRIQGARDGERAASKQAVIARLLEDGKHTGEQLLSFGDGYVEIERTKDVGGLAIGVASNEAEPGHLDVWKRNRLIRAGADIVIADYVDVEALLCAVLR
jgi:phosphoglycolate phosphatase-like HAD superfamily hydrolase